MNTKASVILANLRSHFGGDQAFLSDHQAWNAACPIGIEVEVKWRDYFPGLWKEFLQDNSFNNLSVVAQHELTRRCSELEAFLLPRLEATASCGIEKGADRYWEFAFPPVTDIYILSDQVSLLQKAQLIPEGSHSLHITIGNLDASRNSYYMLLLLEMLACDAPRISSAYHGQNAKLSATWARKGMGGIFEKSADDLKYGYTQAIELRTLALNGSAQCLPLLQTASVCADTLYDLKRNFDTPATRGWLMFVQEAATILNGCGLTDENWKKPNISREYWDTYIAVFEQIRSQVLMAYINHFEHVVNDKITRVNEPSLCL